MLKRPLYTIDDIRNMLSIEYNIKRNYITHLDKMDYIRTIELNHNLRNVPSKLYQDLRTNPGDPTVFDIALGLRKKSYLTGYKLISLMGWTDYMPKVIHVNWVRGTLKQKRNDEIDNFVVQKTAFKPKHRSKIVFRYEDYDIILLSGQFFPVNHKHYFRTPRSLPLPNYSKVPIPEYLALDALVNHHYFGGADTVWKLFIDHAQHLDLKVLRKFYKELNFTYPYANSIGYLLESAGVNRQELTHWENEINKKIQFHLFMGDQERRILNEKWNLYVPQRFTRRLDNN